MVVEPLATLAVGQEAVTGSTLRRALELGLVIETWTNTTKRQLSVSGSLFISIPSNWNIANDL